MRRVMIIDDSLTVRMDLSDLFRAAGFEVVLCGSGADARRALSADDPDLIVLDVVLPDIDGVELLRELRTQPQTMATPVMLLSSESAVKDRVRGLSGGASEYIGKPYVRTDVVGRARALLRTDDDSTNNAPPCVLLVDDSITYREELSTRLGELGYRTATAGSGAEGLRMAAELRPAAIIIDGVMPEMDGATMVRRLRLDPGLHRTPCLLLTASPGLADEVAALDAGADAYAGKADGIDLAVTRLRAILRVTDELPAGTPSASLLEPKRILMVDRSPAYLDALRVEGYDVVQATSGEEALELLAVDAVDAIIVDLALPGVSGIEICRRIKRSPACRRTPLIVTAARDDAAVLVEAINAGADDFASTSTNFELIGARLRALLRRKQIEDESRRAREQLLKKDAETRLARETADARAELLRELAQKNHQLELINQELKTFAYSVSHDLNQPLRAVRGFSELLVEEYGARLDDTSHGYLRRICDGAARMQQLIEGLLLLSHATRQELRPARVRLDQLARTVLDRLRASAPERQVDVRIDEPLEATGDPRLIESLLENLIGNAWKFSAASRPARIEIGSDGAADCNAAVFFVRDNGVGFDAQYSSKLFAPFQRLHSDDRFAGSGIGLATAQRIVYRHHGRISAESTPGEGATFYFTLPAFTMMNKPG